MMKNVLFHSSLLPALAAITLDLTKNVPGALYGAKSTATLVGNTHIPVQHRPDVLKHLEQMRVAAANFGKTALGIGTGFDVTNDRQTVAAVNSIYEAMEAVEAQPEHAASASTSHSTTERAGDQGESDLASRVPPEVAANALNGGSHPGHGDQTQQ